MQLSEVIADLKRCANQNEADASDSAGAEAVAGEQRRMIKILSAVVTRGGARPGSGPKPSKDRCPCKAMTKARAKKRNHKCKSVAGLQGKKT